MDGRVIAQRMIAALKLDPALVQLGTTKGFFKVGVLAELEERRDEVLYDVLRDVKPPLVVGRRVGR